MALFIALPISSYADTASPEESLTSTQIKEHYEYIMNKYQVNEPFSSDDAEFVQKYARAAGAYIIDENQGSATYTIDENQGISAKSSSRSSFQGQQAPYALTGYITLDSSLGRQSWIFYMTAWDMTGIKRNITASVKFDCYGVIDFSTGAIGKIYSNTVSQSSTGTSYLDMTKTDSYSGLPLAVYYYPKASFNGTDVNGVFQ
jgi:hypothetical protein